MKKSKVPETQSIRSENDSTGFSYILPAPAMEGTVSVEKALANRRSHRSFVSGQISSQDISQILWAAYGVTKPWSGKNQTGEGLRTAPSAGGIYPLEIYVLIGNVKDIEPGVYKYIAAGHKITRTINEDMKSQLCAAALGQEMIMKAPACLVYSAVYSRVTERYGERGQDRYVCMDLGHSAENVYLQAEALNLGTCAVGAFKDEEVKAVMHMPDEEEPLYIMPIGRYFDKPEF